MLTDKQRTEQHLPHVVDWAEEDTVISKICYTDV